MTGIDASRDAGFEPLLSIDEVGAVLRISERSVYRLLSRGELSCLKVGQRTLVEPEQLRQFITNQRRLAAVSIPSEG